MSEDLAVLSQEEAETKLGGLNVEWGLIGGYQLDRVYDFPDFKTALEFVNEVGDLAEEHNHHPDIELGWGKVVIHLTSHSAGGLTEADFDLARTIDAMEA